jgi:hypothetical protein
MSRLARTVLVGCVLATAAPGAAQPVGPPIDLQVELTETVGRLADALGREADREQAADALLTLQRAVLEPVRQHAGDGDAEVRLRARQTLAEVLLRTRMQRVLAHLPADQEAKLRALRRARPQLFEDVFSDDLPRRIDAVKRIAETDDPDALAEPVVTLCLGHPSDELATAAAVAAGTGRYRSDAVVAKLVRMLDRDSAPPYRSRYSYDSSSAQQLAVTALRKIASPSAVPALLQRMKSNPRMGDAGLDIAETIGASGELGAIPHLLEMLRDTRVRGSFSVNEIKVTRAPCDPALLALVRLTGQDPARYGFVLYEQRNWRLFGFSEYDDRNKALARFRTWWAEHKDRPPYDAIEPVELPERSLGVARRVRIRPRRTPDEPPAAPASATALPNVTGLAERLSTFADSLAEQFRSDRFEHRRAAQQDLLATGEMLLEPLIGAARRPASRAPVLEVMSRLVVEASVQDYLAELAAGGRAADAEKVLELRRRRPELVTGLFSLSWDRRADALEQLGELPDAALLVEPLLIRNLRHPSKQVARAAVEACGDGRHVSRKLLDELLRIVVEAERRDWRGWWSESLPVAALGTLRRIGARHGSPTLVGLLRRSIGEHNHDVAVPVTHTLAATGDLRLLPLLVDGLDQDDAHYTRSSNNIKMTVAPSDFYLMAALLLTEQRPEDYGFIIWPHSSEGQDPPFGFASDEKRKEAIGKFRDWWARHRDEAPYKDLQPPAVPEFERRLKARGFSQ